MRIILKENQFNYLCEAMKEGFRLDALNTLSYAGKVKYCKQWLGNPIGNGSSRIVFQLDDSKCLKLAKNEKGVAQNEEDCTVVTDNYKASFDLFPKIFQYDGDHTNLYSQADSGETPKYQWIVSEYVLPAKTKDFKVATGYDWKIVQAFINDIDPNRNRRMRRQILSDNDIENILDYDSEHSNFFNSLQSYICDYGRPIGDYLRIANWGMTVRDGEPTMVILDDGFSEYVWNTYYKR